MQCALPLSMFNPLRLRNTALVYSMDTTYRGQNKKRHFITKGEAKKWHSKYFCDVIGSVKIFLSRFLFFSNHKTAQPFGGLCYRRPVPQRSLQLDCDRPAGVEKMQQDRQLLVTTLNSESKYSFKTPDRSRKTSSHDFEQNPRTFFNSSLWKLWI